MRPSSASHKGRDGGLSATRQPLSSNSSATTPSPSTHSTTSEIFSEDEDLTIPNPSQHLISRSITLRNQSLVEAAETSSSLSTAANRSSRTKLSSDNPVYNASDEDDDGSSTSPRFRDKAPLATSSDERNTSNISPSTSSSMNELQTLFSYISQYKPDIIEVEPILFPFLPEYMPAIGDLEAMIKVPAPINDPFFQDLGLTTLDEPTAKQSDPAVLHYQLKSQAKTQSLSIVHQIQHGDTQRLDAWIQNTLSPDWSASIYSPKHRFPSIDVLMEEWDFEFDLPDFQLVDLTLEEKIKVMCVFLQIPIYPGKNGLIQSLHVIFELYSAFLNNQHFTLKQSATSMGSDF